MSSRAAKRPRTANNAAGLGVVDATHDSPLARIDRSNPQNVRVVAVRDIPANTFVAVYPGFVYPKKLWVELVASGKRSSAYATTFYRMVPVSRVRTPGDEEDERLDCARVPGDEEAHLDWCWVIDPTDSADHVAPRFQQSLGPYLNEPSPGQRWNVRWVYNFGRGTLEYWTARRIKAGQELLLCYGADYDRDYDTACDCPKNGHTKDCTLADDYCIGPGMKQPRRWDGLSESKLRKFRAQAQFRPRADTPIAAVPTRGSAVAAARNNAPRNNAAGLSRMPNNAPRANNAPRINAPRANASRKRPAANNAAPRANAGRKRPAANNAPRAANAPRNNAAGPSHRPNNAPRAANASRKRPAPDNAAGPSTQPRNNPLVGMSSTVGYQNASYVELQGRGNASNDTMAKVVTDPVTRKTKVVATRDLEAPRMISFYPGWVYPQRDWERLKKLGARDDTCSIPYFLPRPDGSVAPAFLDPTVDKGVVAPEFRNSVAVHMNAPKQGRAPNMQLSYDLDNTRPLVIVLLVRDVKAGEELLLCRHGCPHAPPYLIRHNRQPKTVANLKWATDAEQHNRASESKRPRPNAVSGSSSVARALVALKNAPRANAPRANAGPTTSGSSSVARALVALKNAPRVNAPRVNAPRVNAPRVNAPRANAPPANAPRPTNRSLTNHIGHGIMSNEDVRHLATVDRSDPRAPRVVALVDIPANKLVGTYSGWVYPEREWQRLVKKGVRGTKYDVRGFRVRDNGTVDFGWRIDPTVGVNRVAPAFQRVTVIHSIREPRPGQVANLRLVYNLHELSAGEVEVRTARAIKAGEELLLCRKEYDANEINTTGCDRRPTDGYTTNLTTVHRLTDAVMKDFDSRAGAVKVEDRYDNVNSAFPMYVARALGPHAPPVEIWEWDDTDARRMWAFSDAVGKVIQSLPREFQTPDVVGALGIIHVRALPRTVYVPLPGSAFRPKREFFLKDWLQRVLRVMFDAASVHVAVTPLHRKKGPRWTGARPGDGGVRAMAIVKPRPHGTTK